MQVPPRALGKRKGRASPRPRSSIRPSRQKTDQRVSQLRMLSKELKAPELSGIEAELVVFINVYVLLIELASQGEAWVHLTVFHAHFTSVESRIEAAPPLPGAAAAIERGGVERTLR